MIDQAVHPANGDGIEAILREELARGDAMAQTVLPILRHLIAAEDSSVFSDEILARVRGMLADLATALLDALARASGLQEMPPHPADEVEQLTRGFVDNPALLSHLHALALEWQLTERLHGRLALEPVVSPLLQALIASPEGATQGLAMTFLAAQARWCQAARRMKLPLRELPGDVLHGVLMQLRLFAADSPKTASALETAEKSIRQDYDEGASRLGLGSRLITSLGSGAQTALSVPHAGVALFLTALALGSGQQRDTVVMATHEAQSARFALALRAAGVEAAGVEQQFLALHPDSVLPDGFDRVRADLAGAILAGGGAPGHFGA